MNSFCATLQEITFSAFVLITKTKVQTKKKAPLVDAYKAEKVTISLTYDNSIHQDTLIGKVTDYVLDDIMKAGFYSLPLCPD
jgi:predicted lactoylglutathione lyase